MTSGLFFSIQYYVYTSAAYRYEVYSDVQCRISIDKVYSVSDEIFICDEIRMSIVMYVTGSCIIALRKSDMCLFHVIHLS